MKQLDYKVLNERLSRSNPKIELVNYIFEVQGASLRRLNYGAAASKLGVHWKTIKSYCDELAKDKIIIFEGKGLKLNDEILNEVG